jgi:subtilisin family serine protease
MTLGAGFRVLVYGLSGFWDWLRVLEVGMRRVLVGVLLFSLAGVWSFVGGSGVVEAASGEIKSQEYVKVLGLDKLKAEGLDGSGVTIAVIDGPVDLSVPELAGVDVDVHPIEGCSYKRPASDVEHGTAVLSLLANKNYGWAPKAHFNVYVTSFAEECQQETRTGLLLQRAMNDGADIISMSIIGDLGYRETYALTRAMLKGIPIVVGVGNDGVFVPAEASLNGQIAVGASDLKGKMAKYSNHGEEEVTLLAPGNPVTLRDVDGKGKLTKVVKGQRGTSFAVPMVSGALALAMQKWPGVNGNQLVRSMLDTADKISEKPLMITEEYLLLDAERFVHNDPTDYETASPVANKNIESPNEQDINDYVNGLVDPQWVALDADYVYRGTDPDILANLPEGMRAEPGSKPGEVSASAEPEPSESASASAPVAPPVNDAGVDGGLLAGVLIGAVVVVAVVIVVVIVLRRKPAADKAKHAE